MESYELTPFRGEYTFEIRALNTQKQLRGQYVATHTIVLNIEKFSQITEEEARKRLYVSFHGANRVFNLKKQVHYFTNGDVIEKGFLV